MTQRISHDADQHYPATYLAESINVAHLADGHLAGGRANRRSRIGQEGAASRADDARDLTDVPHSRDDHRFRPLVGAQCEESSIVGPRVDKRRDLGDLRSACACAAENRIDVCRSGRKIMERADHFGSGHRLCEPIIDIGESRAVVDGVLQDSSFLFDGSLELPATLFSPAGDYY